MREKRVSAPALDDTLDACQPSAEFVTVDVQVHHDS
jgi:hypothetical protein